VAANAPHWSDAHPFGMGKPNRSGMEEGQSSIYRGSAGEGPDFAIAPLQEVL
jgi:hypothetical protein